MDVTKELSRLQAETNTTENILVVDDDPTLRLVVGDMLGDLPYELSMAGSVEEARQALLDQPFSLVIADIRMPKESGVDLLRWAREHCPETPFIMMTGHADVASVADALNLGAQHFLQKPFRPLILIEAVRGVLQSRQLQRQNEQLRRELSNYNSRLRQEVIEAQIQNQRLFFATLTTLTNAIDARDAYTCEHSSQVSRLAAALARHLNLSLEIQNSAEIAGQLHDIGKIAIPEQILLKPSRLSDSEFRRIREHPSYGARILQPLPECEIVLPAVRHHHERFDGNGYPDRLHGEEIPMLARVVAVCDTWSAMRTNRPYREAMPYEIALEVVRHESGHQFDPEIATGFIDMADSRDFHLLMTNHK